MVSFDVVIVLLLLIIIGSVVGVVVFPILFVPLEAFAILIKCLLVVIQFFAMFFLLAMIRS